MNHEARRVGQLPPWQTLNRLEQIYRKVEAKVRWLTYKTLEWKSKLSSRLFTSFRNGLISGDGSNNPLKLGKRILYFRRQQPTAAI
jgi:hypothetical protein